jgi:hypothetical protein
MIDLTPAALRVAPRRVLMVLVLVGVALGAASLFGQYLRFFHGIESAFGFIENFDVEEEASFPTYFSSLLLLAAAFLSAVVARARRLSGDPMAARWGILAVLFAALSVDEAVAIHEMSGNLVPETDALGGILYFGWVVPASVVVVLVGWYFIPFLRDLQNPHRRRILASALVYIGGALGVELVESAIASRTGDETWRYQLVSTFQEVTEMVGISLFVWALLKLIESRGPVVRATVHVAETS